MSNQVMDLNKAQMEQMVAQANSIYQMYNELTEMKSEFRGLYDEIREEFDSFKNTVPFSSKTAGTELSRITKKSPYSTPLLTNGSDNSALMLLARSYDPLFLW